MRELPEDPAEFDRLLAPYRVMVRPLITGVSKGCELADSIPLDKDEKEGGTQAFSALLYQYGGTLDARVLVLLWLVGVILPRVLHYLQTKNDKKPQLRLVEAEKEVNPPP